jgi:homoserine kinase type II
VAVEREYPALLPAVLRAWRLSADAGARLSRPDWGTNNQTFLVVHGDLAASNVLADPDTGQVTALLDFEIAGADFRVQDFLVALSQSGALDAPRWQPRAAAFLRGYAPVRPLTAPEVEALPELLRSRSAGSGLWRAGRWRRGQAELGEVVDRIRRLEATLRWLAASSEELVALVGEASNGQ